MPPKKQKDNDKKDEQECYNTIGPGPIKYVLPPVIGAIHKGPQHDFTRYKYPAWTMRPNSSLGKPFLTPGPGNENKLKKVNPPAYSIKSRHPEKINSFKNQKMINLRDTSKTPAPIWTMHIKPPKLTAMKIPAPNAYLLPSTLKIKHYELKGKYPLSTPPKPKYHNPVDLNIYKNKGPAYTMRPFTKLKEPFKTPGPGSAEFNACKKVKGFSFGLKRCPRPYITDEDKMPCQDVRYV